MPQIKAVSRCIVKTHNNYKFLFPRPYKAADTMKFSSSITVYLSLRKRGKFPQICETAREWIFVRTFGRGSMSPLLAKSSQYSASSSAVVMKQDFLGLPFTSFLSACSCMFFSMSSLAGRIFLLVRDLMKNRTC